jgi:uncharacterized protein YndB with AHSA1/START domain
MTVITTNERVTTTQVFRVFIKATPQAIWDAITTPEWSERYGYASRVEYDLKPGGVYKAFPNEPMKSHGAPDVIIVGEVIEADPPRKLVQTWHPVWEPTIAAESITRLTWEIEEQRGGVTRLTVTHDVADAPLTARMVAGDDPNAGGGWSYMLSDMKTLLETGKSLAG